MKTPTLNLKALMLALMVSGISLNALAVNKEDPNLTNAFVGDGSNLAAQTPSLEGASGGCKLCQKRAEIVAMGQVGMSSDTSGKDTAR